MFKSLLVPLFGKPQDGTVLGFAHRLARHFEAHVDALHIRHDPLRELNRLTVADGIVTKTLWDAIEDDIRTHHLAARKTFDRFCESNALRILEQPQRAGETASWFESVGDFSTELGARGRYHDLIVTGRYGLSAGELGDILVRSGRPVLLASNAKPAHTVFDMVAVGWKDTANSARAMTSAMPLMRAARQVVVLTVAEDGDNSQALQSAERLAVNLRWHGIVPELRCLAPHHQEVGETLVDAAAGMGAGLLVMGGYGHSRAREFVLGGATRYLLESADFPVFIVH